MRPTNVLVPLVAAGSLALAGCSGAPGGDGLDSAVVGTPSGTAGETAVPDGPDTGGTGAAAETGATGAVAAALRGTPPDVGGPYGTLRDGVWRVGPAGEVEFRVVDGSTLELVDVRPADGWTVTDQDVDPDEIEVDFRQGPVRYEIEVEIEGGVLEIEIDQDIEPAEVGVFEVGEAAAVELDVVDGELVLVDVRLRGGWSEVSRDVERDEVEVDFRRDGDGFVETWEVDAELDDGVLDVEVDYEIEGVFGG